MRDTVPTSTPGVPLAGVAPNNRRLLEEFLQLAAEAVVERLEEMLEVEALASLSYDAGTLVRRSLRDPVKVFVKNEPHKRMKLLLERYRLISCVSFVDQIIERVLYTPQAKLEISLWRHLLVKPGMGATDDDFRSIWDMKLQLEQIGLCLDTDVEGWDWSVKR